MESNKVYDGAVLATRVHYSRRILAEHPAGRHWDIYRSMDGHVQSLVEGAYEQY